MTTEIEAWVTIQLDEYSKISQKKKFMIEENLTEKEQRKEVMNELRTLIQTNKKKINVTSYHSFTGDKFIEGSSDKLLKYYFCELFFKKDEKFTKGFVVAMPDGTSEQKRKDIMNSIAMKYIKWGFSKKT